MYGGKSNAWLTINGGVCSWSVTAGTAVVVPSVMAQAVGGSGSVFDAAKKRPGTATVSLSNANKTALITGDGAILSSVAFTGK